MPLPTNFSEFRHLQDQVRRIHNERVLAWFSDAPDEDISTSRGSLKHACLIKPEDSAAIVAQRQWLFDVTAGQAKSLHPDIYGIPVTTFQEQVRFKPQVTLHFLESLETVEEGYSAVEGEISFRLINATNQDVTPTEAEALAQSVKSAMTDPLFVMRKGRILCTYKDLDNGYNFRLFVTGEDEARRVIEQVLLIQGHSPDWEFLVIHESRQTFPIVPPEKTIYGRNRRTPRRRPRADVRFRYATLNIHGLQNPVTLLDTTGFRSAPLEVA
jgi:hypothetical protein